MRFINMTLTPATAALAAKGVVDADTRRYTDPKSLEKLLDFKGLETIADLQKRAEDLAFLAQYSADSMPFISMEESKQPVGVLFESKGFAFDDYFVLCLQEKGMVPAVEGSGFLYHLTDGSLLT